MLLTNSAEGFRRGHIVPAANMQLQRTG
jgi:hypothetical protein